MKEIANIIENFIFDFFNIDKVNELLNTKDDAIEMEKHLRKLLTHYLFKLKGEQDGESTSIEE